MGKGSRYGQAEGRKEGEKGGAIKKSSKGFGVTIMPRYVLSERAPLTVEFERGVPRIRKAKKTQPRKEEGIAVETLAVSQGGSQEYYDQDNKEKKKIPNNAQDKNGRKKKTPRNGAKEQKRG